MTRLPQWSEAQLADDVEEARRLFREQRLREPRAQYSRFFRQFVPVFCDLVRQLPELGDDALAADAIVGLVTDEDKRTAFRYLAAPPISDDDLKELAQSKLSARTLRSNPEEARRVRDTVLHILDPHRFPWVAEGSEPTQSERERAVVASAALVAARKVETQRRAQGGRDQLMQRLGFQWMENSWTGHCWWQIDGAENTSAFQAAVEALTGVAIPANKAE